MRFVVLTIATGCSFSPVPEDLPKDGQTDTTPLIDSTPGVDGTPTMPCFGPAGWEVCLSSVPINTEMIAGSFDTEDDDKCANPLPSSWTAAGQPDACIVIAKRIDVTGTEVVVKGTRPLVLVASEMITIAGTLDAGSHRDPINIGPGAPSANCTSGQSPETEGAGGGGGAGGSFMTAGGQGGDGDQGDQDASGGRPGDALALPPDKLRAGCRGQTGAQNGGPAGQGGGAVYLVAGVSITGGRIDASGAGANESGAGAGRTGGSGGGSGGMVALFAPTISLASINANGGGASAGANTPNSGADGSDADVATPDQAAAGGNGAGGTGGDGFATGEEAGNGAQGALTVGGGGGGGGAGVIRANVKASNSLSPPQSGL